MQTTVQLADGMFAIIWTALRVGGVVMLAPLLGAIFVPRRVRLAMTIVIALALAASAGPPPATP